jgi:Fe2+ transport system protein B
MYYNCWITLPISCACNSKLVGAAGIYRCAVDIRHFAKRSQPGLLISFAGGAAITTIMTPLQMVVFTIVILIYIPCISTIAVLLKETGFKITTLMVVAEIALAILIGGVAYRLLGLFF